MAGRTGCRGSRRGSQEALRRPDIVQTDGQSLFGAVDVAHTAIPHIADGATFGERRERHIREIVVTSPEPDHNVGLSLGSQSAAAMNLVDQEREGDSLGWRILVVSVGGRRTPCLIGLGRIVAQNAHLNLIAILAVHRKRGVATIAFRDVDHLAAELNRRAVDGKVHDLVYRAVLCIGNFSFSSPDGESAPAFHTN